MKAPFLLSLLFPACLAWAGPSSDNLATALRLSRERGLAQDLQWQRLLHYKKTMLGFFESQLDGPAFFLAPKGKFDSQAELDATLTAIFEEAPETPEEKSAICRFPARQFYLRSKLGDAVPWVQRSCPRFERWFQTLRGTSISLVFSSYFLNNPASTFGHTFLRINKAPSVRDGERYELLDYGVNFAANATTSNGLAYAYMGLFGGFPGTFTTMPYYYKVREYNNAESRDLWQYELSLTTDQVDLIVAQVWELGPTYADYWYLTENCSYFVLTLLEAADPTLNLTDGLKKYVIPTDTVHEVWAKPGLVKGWTFRPSTRTELFARLQGLTQAERDIVAATVEKKTLHSGLESLLQDRRRLVLDAAIDNMDYSYSVSVQKPESEAAIFKNKLLSMRSQIPQITERLKVDPPALEAPHFGHGSRRVQIGAMESKQEGASLTFGYKFALHDFLDPAQGYPQYAQIGFFDFDFQYFERAKKLELSRFMMFEVVSLTPYSQFSKSLSWNLHVGSERMKNQDCPGCHAGFVVGGAGRALQLSDSPLFVGYLGIKGGVYYTASGGEATEPGKLNFPRFLVGAGPHLLMKASWSDQWISTLEGWARFDLRVNHQQSHELSFATQWSPNRSWGLRLKGEERWFERSVSLQTSFYY